MKTSEKFEIMQSTWPERHFVVKREKVPFDKLPAFFEKNYGLIYSAIQKYNLATNEPPCAIYYSIDEERKETDVSAAVPVKGDLSPVQGLEKVIIPPSKILRATHYGSYDNMVPIYAEMEKYLKEHNSQRDLIIEEYFSDPEVEKDPGKWKTNIVFVLK